MMVDGCIARTIPNSPKKCIFFCHPGSGWISQKKTKTANANLKS